MEEEQPDRLRGHLRRGLVTSFLLHAAALAPLVIAAVVLGGREQAQRAEEMDVAFDAPTPTDLPDDLPSITDDASPVKTGDKSKKPEKAPQAQADQPLPQEPKKQQTQAEKEPEIPLPDKLPPIPPPPKPIEKAHEKVVDLDLGKTVEPPPDAKYLAQKNNRVEQETRATETNLDREQKGNEGSSPSKRRDQQSGDDADKIAELEDVHAQLGRRAPAVTPQANPALADSEQVNKSVLAMRDALRRQHEITPETADPSLPSDRDGLRDLPEKGVRGAKASGGQKGAASSPRLQLTGEDIEYAFGEEAEAERKLAQKTRSKHGGHFAERAGRVRSALENFIPEVKPGNQTALNTRAAPFAVFIARVHRQIHKLWGFDILEEWSRKSGSNELNNPNLVSQLELVLKDDGEIDKVSVVRSSGLVTFDAAAIDAVYSAGPFPEPPAEIRSANGKIYIHWSFHRDDRQCSPAFAEPFILDNAPKGDAPTAGVPGLQPRAGRRFHNAVPDTAEHRAKMRELDEAAGGPEGNNEEVPARTAARSDDPRARAVAERFFAGYARADVNSMLPQIKFPLRSSGGASIRDAGELKQQLHDLQSEAGGSAAVRALQIYAPVAARSVLGALPDGFSEDASLLFAVARVSDDTFVAVLSPHDRDWKVVGFLRR